MAIYNELLAGRFNRALQKLLSMKGTPPSRQLGGEISPNLETESLLALENRVLISWHSFAYTKTVAAQGVGNLAGVRLRNPSGSNVIVVIEKALFSTGAAGVDTPAFRRGTGLAALGTIDTANEFSRDIRMGTNFVSSSEVSFGTVTGGVTGWQGQILANTSIEAIIDQNQEVVVAPGDSFTLLSQTTNIGFTCSFMWRERALEESELLVGAS